MTVAAKREDKSRDHLLHTWILTPSKMRAGNFTARADPLALYDDEDLVFLEEVDENEDFGDPCHEFEHSIFFFFLLLTSFAIVVCYSVLLAKR